MTDTAVRADLADWAGVFDEGWTDEHITAVAPALGRVLQLPGVLVCVWDRLDAFGGAGDSQLYLLRERALYEVDGEFWALFCEPVQNDEHRDRAVDEVLQVLNGPAGPAGLFATAASDIYSSVQFYNEHNLYFTDTTSA